MALRKRLFRIVAIFLAFPPALFLILSLLFPLPSPKPYSLVVEDRQGRFLHAFLADDGVWRLRTSPDEIPDRLKSFLIRREDRWFYFHPGVNPVAVIRAAIQNLEGGKRISGASTITMQIARMLEPRERTYWSKLVEMFRALQLEVRYSKKEILELYLSMVPLGGNIEGVKSAAMIYYQTPLERLNLAQLVDLTLIPGDPNTLRPDRNAEVLLARRRASLAHWMQEGYFTREDSIVLWDTPAGVARSELPRRAPHFAQRIREKFQGTPLIRSSLDLLTQQTVERLLTNHLRPWNQKGIRNGAVIVLENATGSVVAYAGSQDFFDRDADGQVDAVRALRSPGSTLKPFLYALQMERGELTPRSRLFDVPYDAEGFLAENYDGTYSGLVYADEALRRSLNVPMIRLLKTSGLPEFLEFLQRMGFSSLNDQRSKLGLSMILGGCGVTLEELTTAYASLPRGGTFVSPHFTADAPERAISRAFSQSTAYMITEILSSLDRPDLPNNFATAINLPTIAFKTGTSYGRKDAWAIGYTAGYTVGVWIGNADNQGNPELVGSKSAAPLLVDILNCISLPGEKAILPRPPDIGTHLVCAKSGRLPTPRCTHLIEETYSRGQTIPRLCDVCREYLVSDDGRMSFCPSCVGDYQSKSVTFEDYPAELLSYWRTTGTRFREPPPHNPLCTRVYAGPGPEILSPSNDMTYYLAASDQQIFLRASSGVDVREHIWYMDEHFLRREKPGRSVFVEVTEGTHTITCVDDRGRVSRIKISVRILS